MTNLIGRNTMLLQPYQVDSSPDSENVVYEDCTVGPLDNESDPLLVDNNNLTEIHVNVNESDNSQNNVDLNFDSNHDYDKRRITTQEFPESNMRDNELVEQFENESDGPNNEDSHSEDEDDDDEHLLLRNNNNEIFGSTSLSSSQEDRVKHNFQKSSDFIKHYPEDDLNDTFREEESQDGPTSCFESVKNADCKTWGRVFLKIGVLIFVALVLGALGYWCFMSCCVRCCGCCGKCGGGGSQGSTLLNSTVTTSSNVDSQRGTG